MPAAGARRGETAAAAGHAGPEGLSRVMGSSPCREGWAFFIRGYRVVVLISLVRPLPMPNNEVDALGK